MHGEGAPGERHWDAAAAIDEARQQTSALRGDDAAVATSGDDALSVAVQLREVYFPGDERQSRVQLRSPPRRDRDATPDTPGAHDHTVGRRACAFTVSFRSVERELQRSEVGMWQARMREALLQWADAEGTFSLR